MSWSLVQKSPTECGASLCVIQKPQEWGGHDQRWVTTPQKKILIAQHVSGDTSPIIRSSKTVITASGFTYVFGCGCNYSFELLMMGGVSPETCWAIKKHWNNKFYYTVASCWLFLWDKTLSLPRTIKGAGKYWMETAREVVILTSPNIHNKVTCLFDVCLCFFFALLLLLGSFRYNIVCIFILTSSVLRQVHSLSKRIVNRVLRVSSSSITSFP